MTLLLTWREKLARQLDAFPPPDPVAQLCVELEAEEPALAQRMEDAFPWYLAEQAGYPIEEIVSLCLDGAP